MILCNQVLLLVYTSTMYTLTLGCELSEQTRDAPVRKPAISTDRMAHFRKLRQTIIPQDERGDRAGAYWCFQLFTTC